MALSDLEVGAGKAGAGRIIDSAKSKQKPAVGLNPWKLARVTTEDAARAAARARAKSSILHPHRPGSTETLAVAGASVDTDSSSNLQSSSAGEIRLASRSGRSRKPPGLPREIWSRNKQDRISPLGTAEDSDPAAMTSLNSSLEGSLPALPLEPRSSYLNRSPNDAYTGDPRASYPAPQGPYPPHILFPRFPGDPGRSEVPSAVNSSADGVRISVNSDGYEASCGESGDDTSDAVGLSQSWNQPTWSNFAKPPDRYKEEDVKPWVASFPAAGSPVPSVVGSPGGKIHEHFHSDLDVIFDLLHLHRKLTVPKFSVYVN